MLKQNFIANMINVKNVKYCLVVSMSAILSCTIKLDTTLAKDEERPTMVSRDEELCPSKHLK